MSLRRKNAAKASGKPLTGDCKLGFLTHGLFRFSRHPNFFCEQSVWCSFYLFGVAASGDWFNYTGIGAVLLIILFQSSTGLTEDLSIRKYPKYREYQRTTSRLAPWLPGPEVTAD